MPMFQAVTLVAALLLGVASASWGQAPGAQADSKRPKRGEGLPAFGPPRFGPPSFALKDALDADRDGKLSDAEIRSAAESLKRLDKDRDGKLSAEEIGWPPRFPGFPPGGGPPGGRRPGGGPPGGGPGFPFGGREQAGRSFAERLLGRDANQDGKLTKEELPRSMHFLIGLADLDKNAAIDKKEAERLASQFGLEASQRDPDASAP